MFHHGRWSGDSLLLSAVSRPDLQATPGRQRCATSPASASSLPSRRQWCASTINSYSKRSNFRLSSRPVMTNNGHVYIHILVQAFVVNCDIMQTCGPHERAHRMRNSRAHTNVQTSRTRPQNVELTSAHTKVRISRTRP